MVVSEVYSRALNLFHGVVQIGNSIEGSERGCGERETLDASNGRLRVPREGIIWGRAHHRLWEIDKIRCFWYLLASAAAFSSSC